MGRILRFDVKPSYNVEDILHNPSKSAELIEAYIDKHKYIDSIMFNVPSVSVTGNVKFASLAGAVQDISGLTVYISSSDYSIVKNHYISQLCDYNTLEMSPTLMMNLLSDNMSLKVTKPSCVFVFPMVFKQALRRFGNLLRTMHFFHDDLDFEGIILVGEEYPISPKYVMEQGKFIIQGNTYYKIFDTAPDLFSTKRTTGVSLSCGQESLSCGTQLALPEGNKKPEKKNKKFKLIEID